MPWSGAEFKAKHNKGLNDKQANKAAKIATAMYERGEPEGEAIATANKYAKKSKGHGVVKDQTAKGMAGQRKSWRGA